MKKNHSVKTEEKEWRTQKKGPIANLYLHLSCLIVNLNVENALWTLFDDATQM